MGITTYRQGRDRVARALLPFGFADDGRSFRWVSQKEGRSWKARFSQERRTKYYGEVRVRHTHGYRLRVDTTTRVMVRGYFVREGFAANAFVRWWHRRRGFEALPHPVGPGQYRVVANDTEWMMRLLGDANASAAITTLLEFREAFGAASSLYFEPGGLHYASPLWPPDDDIDEGHVGTIVSALAALAREAERQPPPGRPATIGRIGVFAKAHPLVVAVVVLASFMFAGLLIVLLLFAIAWVVFG